MKRWPYILVAFLGCALYANTLGHGYVLDDKAIITQNEFTKSGWSGVADHFTHSYWYGLNGKDEGNYRPISGVSFAIERAIFGKSPAVGHFLNMLAFGLLCLVLLKWLNRLQLLPESWNLLVVILFAAHPIHTEVVANIKSRDELYAALFFVSSALFYGRWLAGKKWQHGLYSGIFYLLACLSKETAFALLPVFPIMAKMRGNGWSASLKMSLTPLAVATFYLLLYVSVTDVLSAKSYHLFDNALVQEAPAINLLATKLHILGRYIALLFVPYPLRYDYSYNTIPLTGFGDPFVWLFIAAILLISIALWRAFRQNSTSGWKLALASSLFILPLIPVSNLLFPIGSTMAERFLFMPSLGFLLLVVVGMINAWKRVMKNERPLQYLIAAVALVLAVITIYRNGDWQDEETLFRNDLPKLTNSAKAHHNLANIYREKARSAATDAQKVTYNETAATLLEQALDIYPVQEFYKELGATYGDLGKWDGVKKALGAYVEMDPNNALVWMQLGIARGISNEFDPAREAFERAYQLDPDSEEICLNLAKTYAIIGQNRRSVELMDAHLKTHPNSPMVLSFYEELTQP